jgi:hypothetical protein
MAGKAAACKRGRVHEVFVLPPLPFGGPVTFCSFQSGLCKSHALANLPGCMFACMQHGRLRGLASRKLRGCTHVHADKDCPDFENTENERAVFTEIVPFSLCGTITKYPGARTLNDPYKSGNSTAHNSGF